MKNPLIDWKAFSAVIFDMDGVIVDTEPGYYEALNEYLLPFGIHVSLEVNRQLIGVPYSRIFEVLQEEYGLQGVTSDEVVEGMERIRKANIKRDGYVAVDGTRELIHLLKKRGIRTAIASSSPGSAIEEVMDAVGIRENIDAYVSGHDECTRGKPDPEIFLTAAKKLGVEPKRCVVVEDAISGVRGAKAAGMYVIGYRNPFGGQELTDADLVVEEIEELLCLS